MLRLVLDYRLEKIKAVLSLCDTRFMISIVEIFESLILSPIDDRVIQFAGRNKLNGSNLMVWIRAFKQTLNI